jgi:hypothetical protein
MATSKLQDDLLNEFREEKRLVTAQINIFDPLGMSLRKPAAHRLANKGLIIFSEIVCWLAVLSSIAFAIFLNKLYPFYLLFQIRNPEYSKTLGVHNIQILQWCVYGLIALSGLLFLFLARTLGRIRQKNDILNLAGKHIKTLVGQHLTRKAAIEAIEQRHFMELPQLSEFPQDVNDVLNPGYDQGSVERII